MAEDILATEVDIPRLNFVAHLCKEHRIGGRVVHLRNIAIERGQTALAIILRRNIKDPTAELGRILQVQKGLKSAHKR